MKLPLLSLAALLVLPFAARAQDHHWGYDPKHGGARAWAKEAPTCGTGKHQSPIDLKTKASKGKTQKPHPRIGFQWAKMKGTLVNNGHTFQVNLPAGSSIDFGEGKYDLLQFHFHAKSEHTVNGKHSPMEVHFVHKGGDKLAVVGILLEDVGAANAAFKPVFDGFAKPGEVEVDLPSMLPKEHGYLTYPGSLTTPPCSEGVHWMVLQEHGRLSKAQVKSFLKAFPHGNARPTQSLGDRAIESGAE